MLRLLLLLALSVPAFADDNEITIKQDGDNFDLDITQIGYDNIIKQWTASEKIDGDDNTVIIKQSRDRGTGTYYQRPLPSLTLLASISGTRLEFLIIA